MGGFNLLDLAISGRFRAESIIGNPLAATAFYILTLPIVLTYAFVKENRNSRWLYLSVGIMLILGLLLILSRSAILAIAVSIMFIVYNLKKDLFVKVCAIVIISALIYLSIPHF